MRTTYFSFLFFFSAFLVILTAIGCKDSSSENEDEERLEMDGVGKAIRQEFLMTRDPSLNMVPKERLLSAWNYLKTARTMQTNDLVWTERGPNNIGGRCRAILVDKRDPTGNTVFAGSVSGGLFKTTNFTSPSATWTVINDFLPTLAITCLVQDNTDPNVMYAGTGEGWFNIDAIRGSGIFKSTDGGVTWNVLPSTVKISPKDSTFEYVQDLAIDSNGAIYASLRNLSGLSRGVKRSTDGGATWTQVLGQPLADFAYTTGRAADLEVASNGDVYATLGVFSRTMVFKSSFATHGANTGAFGTWQEITPPHTKITFRGELAVAPSNPQRLYLMMQDSTTDMVDSVYRSDDGGTSWTAFAAPTAVNNGSNSQTWYDLIAAVDPSNPDIVIVGGLELARSVDGGATWTTISSSAAVHVDQHALIFFNSSRLVIGNDGGIYYSSNISSATPAFTAKNAGFNVTQFYGCDFHPTDANYFLAGAQDNNTQKFTTAGLNSTTAVVGGDGGFPHIDQSDGVIQIAATSGNQFYRSINGGTSFQHLATSTNKGRFISPTDYDDSLKVLYASDDEGKYYCITNLTGSPAAITNTLTQLSSNHQVSAIKVDPTATGTIWLAASVGDNATANVIPRILKISNANTNMPSVLVNVSLPVPSGAYISSIDVDAANGNHILATLSNYGVVSVFESTNGGTSWNNIEGNLPDMPVYWGIFAPPGAQLSGATGGGVILGTDLGVWTTSAINGALTQWIANNSGLANVPVHMIKYRSGNTSLVAATHGRGLYTATLTGVVTGVSNNVITKDFIKYISADKNQLLIVRGSLNTIKMQIQIYDLAGRLLYNQEHPYQNLSVPISQWSKGSYVIKIQGNNKENFVQQFVKQ